MSRSAAPRPVRARSLRRQHTLQAVARNLPGLCKSAERACACCVCRPEGQRPDLTCTRGAAHAERSACASRGQTAAARCRPVGRACPCPAARPKGNKTQKRATHITLLTRHTHTIGPAPEGARSAAAVLVAGLAAARGSSFAFSLSVIFVRSVWSSKFKALVLRLSLLFFLEVELEAPGAGGTRRRRTRPSTLQFQHAAITTACCVRRVAGLGADATRTRFSYSTIAQISTCVCSSRLSNGAAPLS